MLRYRRETPSEKRGPSYEARTNFARAGREGRQGAVMLPARPRSPDCQLAGWSKLTEFAVMVPFGPALPRIWILSPVVSAERLAITNLWICVSSGTVIVDVPSAYF